MIAEIIQKLCIHCIKMFAEDVAILHVAIHKQYFQYTFSVSMAFQIVLADYLGKFEFDLPSHKVLQSLSDIPMQLCPIVFSDPIPHARALFLDGCPSSHRAVVAWYNSETNTWINHTVHQEGSVQVTEL